METNIKVQVVCPGFTKTDFHNKMGMDISKKKNKGLIHWSTPDEVVNISMRDLSRNKVVCIPSFNDKMLIWLLGLLPRNTYYKFMYNFSIKKQKNEK